MPQCGQCVPRPAGSVAIIHPEQTDASFWPYIHKNQWHIALGELLQQWFSTPKVITATPSALAPASVGYAQGHAPGIIVGGTDENLVAVLDSDVFKALYELGEEGIGDFGNDRAERPGCVPKPAPGPASWGSNRAFRSPPTLAWPSSGFPVGTRLMVQRDGGDGHVSQLRHGPDIQFARHFYRQRSSPLPAYLAIDLPFEIRLQHTPVTPAPFTDVSWLPEELRILMANQHSYQRFDLKEIARSFPDTAETMLLDTYLTNEEAASARVFRVYRETPAH